MKTARAGTGAPVMARARTAVPALARAGIAAETPSRVGALAAAALMAAAVTAAAHADPGSAPDVSFKRDIAPLLKVRCAPCHLTGDEAFGMALHPGAAYRTLVNVASGESPLPRVKPGSPEQSYLVRKIEGTQLEAGGKGVRMPLDGEPLDRNEIDLIRAWISQGAKND